ncbi:hypothetical protein MPER_08175 [Moniliophthora perniciosa FA553]|nr:hypothetical protein MPER_08175 [Moniliophthora perniciosa FA553]
MKLEHYDEASQGKDGPGVSVAEMDINPSVSSVDQPSPGQAEEEEDIHLERGPDGLFREEEVVPHLFESDRDDGELLHCPFCLLWIQRRVNNTTPRNFAGAPITILLQHYRENHSHILEKIMLYYSGALVALCFINLYYRCVFS